MVLSLEGPVNPLPSSLSHHPSPITPLSSLFHHPSLSCFQVYAPISGQERSFHRTIFVFCCKTHECYTCNNNRCVKGNIAASLASSSSQKGRMDGSVLPRLCSGPCFPAHIVSHSCSSQFSEVSYQGGMSSTPSTLHQVGHNLRPGITGRM